MTGALDSEVGRLLNGEILEGQAAQVAKYVESTVTNVRICLDADKGQIPFLSDLDRLADHLRRPEQMRNHRGRTLEEDLALVFVWLAEMSDDLFNSSCFDTLYEQDVNNMLSDLWRRAGGTSSAWSQQAQKALGTALARLAALRSRFPFTGM